MLRHARHVVEELIGSIGAEVGGFDFSGREIGNQGFDVVDAVINDADRAGGEAAIAAGFRFRRRFQHQHFGAVFLRGKSRAKGGIAGADHDYIHDFIHSRQP